jgi:hypothetical protein
LADISAFSTIKRLVSTVWRAVIILYLSRARNRQPRTAIGCDPLLLSGYAVATVRPRFVAISTPWLDGDLIH